MSDTTEQDVPTPKPARDLRQELTNKLVQSLEQGQIPWDKPWRELPLGLPRNMETGREYRGGNRLMLLMEQADRGYVDPRYGTIKQINALGGRVKKGERGIPVEIWKEQPFYDRKDVTVTLNGMRVKVFGERGGMAEIGMPTDEASTLRVKTSELRVEQRTKEGARDMSWSEAHALDTWVGRVHTVFNVAQCEGLKLEPIVPPPNFDPVARAEAIRAAMEKDGLKFAEHPTHAFYSPKRDEVSLPPRSAFNSEPGKDDGAARYYGTMLHEIGHATGAEKRLNREGITGGHRFGSEGYAREELRAEMFSLFMAVQTGIPYDPKRHTAYVQSWADVLKKDKNEIFRAAAEASKAVDYVLDKEQSLQVAQERQRASKEQQQEKPPTPGHEHSRENGRDAKWHTKRADQLRRGDVIMERIPGHAGFVYRVDEVRFIGDGKVRVVCNQGNATRTYDASELVTVPGRAPDRQQSSQRVESNVEKDGADTSERDAGKPKDDRPERAARPRVRQAHRKVASMER